MTKPILYIDTDMGVDDIVAICMLIASGKFTIRGISVVNGVTPVRIGSANLYRILKFIGVSIPLFLGADQNEQGSDIQFPRVDRKRASALTLLPNINLPQAQDLNFSLSALISKIKQEKNPVRFICLGPLTNMATLLQNAIVRKNISDLTIMGGAINVPGNVSPKFISEYNFRLDAKAADYVLNCGFPVTLVPIDATKSAPATVEKADTNLLPLLLKFYDKITVTKTNCPTGKIIKSIILNNRGDFDNFYDPLAAAVLLNPKLVIRSRKSPISIIPTNRLKGKVIRKVKGNPVTIIEKVNTESFLGVLVKFMQNQTGRLSYN